MGRNGGSLTFRCGMLRHFDIGVVSFDPKLLKQLGVNDSLLTLPFGFRREHGTMQRAGFLRLRAVSKIFQIRIGTAVFACAKVAVFAYGDRDDGVRLRKCSN